MKKLNDEQLSRVLTAHSNGKLEIAGVSPDAIGTGNVLDTGNWGCLAQVALCDASTMFPGGSSWSSHRQWFDTRYKPHWTRDQFLRALEKAGIA